MYMINYYVIKFHSSKYNKKVMGFLEVKWQSFGQCIIIFLYTFHPWDPPEHADYLPAGALSQGANLPKVWNLREVLLTISTQKYFLIISRCQHLFRISLQGNLPQS
jgi:hypothetical protein